jgi:hypothetical protein
MKTMTTFETLRLRTCDAVASREDAPAHTPIHEESPARQPVHIHGYNQTDGCACQTRSCLEASGKHALARPFFTAAILIALTLGATWGAYLLWKIGAHGTFTGAGLQEINAHGEAQIMGWVGLFIMGFAYQAFPRLWQTKLAAPRVAVIVLALMLAGIIGRTIGMVQGEAELALGAGALQVLAAWTFAAQIFATFERSRMPLQPWVVLVLTATCWMALASVLGAWHTWMTMTAGSHEELLFYVSTYQGALRDAQIHGVALLMILGVSTRILPAMFGLPSISTKRAILALFLLSLAVAGEVSFFMAYRWTEHWALAAALYAMWAMLACGVVTLVWPWRSWFVLVGQAPRQQDQAAKFVRVAYLWLAVSLSMLLLVPAYQALCRLSDSAPHFFSHAYFGAVRHAITVGFISMMIMGVGSKVIGSVNLRSRAAGGLWGPFALVNLGCLLRVTIQPLTDFAPVMFKFIAISGALEVLGLAWWGLTMIGLMWWRKPAAASANVAWQT